MGLPWAKDGSVFSCNLDGGNLERLIPASSIHTPKQIAVDDSTGTLYFADREGECIWRCDVAGANLRKILCCGVDGEEMHMRRPVGLAIDVRRRQIVWTQKGPPKGGRGRIFRSGLDALDGLEAEQADVASCLLDSLPEPIDVQIDHENNTLYWTDLGDPPHGNSLNRLNLDTFDPNVERDSLLHLGYEVLDRGLREPIGLHLDLEARHVYVTALGGFLYRIAVDRGKRTTIYQGDENNFTGLVVVPACFA